MIDGEQQPNKSVMSSLPPSYEVATYRYEHRKPPFTRSSQQLLTYISWTNGSR